jgi:hypothetical protein
MNDAKIQFSPAEMELMNNSALILTKNKVLLKIKTMLEGLQEELVHTVYQQPDFSSHPIFQESPKISKGENYLGLPYLVLDYPRIFDSLNILAIRTMFWWGHFFSVTLHTSGVYKDDIMAVIQDRYAYLAQNQFYIGVNEDPWQHHFEEDNYLLIADIDEAQFRDYCSGSDHLKIAAQFPLWDANFVMDDLYESWKKLAQLATI